MGFWPSYDLRIKMHRSNLLAKSGEINPQYSILYNTCMQSKILCSFMLMASYKQTHTHQADLRSKCNTRAVTLISNFIPHPNPHLPISPLLSIYESLCNGEKHQPFFLPLKSIQCYSFAWLFYANMTTITLSFHMQWIWIHIFISV